MKGWLRFIPLFTILSLLISGMAIPTLEVKATPQEDLLERTLRYYVEELKKDPATRGMIVGYKVVSLNSGEVLAELRGEKTFVPGTSMQLLLAATLLDQLSQKMRIPTKLYIDGTLSPGGILKGDIVLKGYGDPTLQMKDLERFAEALRKKGIRRVQGNIVVDDTFFDDVRLGESWMWDQEPYPFSAQIGALSVEGNTVAVKVEPNRIGKPPRVTVTPGKEYMRVVNQAKTVSGKKASLTIDRTLGKNELVITGEIGVHHKGVLERRTVEDPARFTGTLLQEILKKRGIKFHPHSKVITGTKGKQAKEVKRIESATLDKLLQRMIKEDNPFYAEMLLKQLGAQRSDEGSAEAGIEVIRDFSRKQGIDLNYRQKDGSGLSRMNVISPQSLVQLLQAMENHPAKSHFTSLLSLAGGALEDRMKGTPAEKNLQAKWGEMVGVSGMVGRVTTRNGDELAFAILLNGVKKSVSAQKLADRMAVAMATYPELPTPGEVPVPKKYPLSSQIDPLLLDHRYRGVLAGVMVYSLDRKQVLYAHDEELLFTPASNTKLFTSSAALAALGADYRYRTEIYRDGPIQKGTIKGDLVIKGYGDPTLATEGSLQVQVGTTIEQIARDLKALGIRRVEGNILVDKGVFTDHPYGKGWAWDDESYYYQPQIEALAINRGTVRFDYLPGDKPGDPIRLEMTPKTRYVKVIDEAVTGPAGSKVTLRLERDRGTNRIRLTGSIPLDFSGDYTRVPVDHPHLYTGYVLKETMELEGISFSPNSSVRSGTKPKRASLVKTYYSPPLSEVINYLNKVSDNFYAEMILRTLGWEVNGVGSAAAGRKVVADYGKQFGLGSYYTLEDGSGLTRYNSFSPQQIIRLLIASASQPTEAAFVDSLPLAGVDGTLRTRMTNTAAAGNLRGKTGSLTNVSALSGYVQSQDGERLAYAIMLNGYAETSLKTLEDEIGIRLAEFSRE